MLAKMIEKILELKKPEVIDIAGRKLVAAGYNALKEPVLQSINIHTLSGIAGYLRDNPDKLEQNKIIVNVVNQTEVLVFSSVIGMERQREYLLTAEPLLPRISLDTMLSCEDFIIMLQSMFVQDETTAEILKIVGNITESATRTHSDNGVSQQVTVKQGITGLENVIVPNPVELRPFRTFHEVAQPASRFVLRLRGGNENHKPTCGLFEADGGAWKNDAIYNIEGWLKDNLTDHAVPGGITIIA